MNKLLTDDLWGAVEMLTRRTGRVQAAVSYVTTLKHLKLRRGDTLIVDASHRAIQGGETNARTLWDLRGRVRLFSLPNLHAKFVLAGNKLVVGSANASESSALQLVESAILTDCPTLVAQARSYLSRLEQLATPLDAEKLKALKAIKVVRRPTRTSGLRPRKLEGRATWVVSTEDLDDHEHADEESHVAAAVRDIQNRTPAADPTWIRWDGNARIRTETKKDDRFIVICKRKDGRLPYEVLAPVRVLKVQTRGKWTRFYYDPDLEPSLKTITWKRFKDLLKRTELNERITPNSVRTLAKKAGNNLFNAWPQFRRK